MIKNYDKFWKMYISLEQNEDENKTNRKFWSFTKILVDIGLLAYILFDILCFLFIVSYLFTEGMDFMIGIIIMLFLVFNVIGMVFIFLPLSVMYAYFKKGYPKYLGDSQLKALNMNLNETTIFSNLDEHIFFGQDISAFNQEYLSEIVQYQYQNNIYTATRLDIILYELNQIDNEFIKDLVFPNLYMLMLLEYLEKENLMNEARYTTMFLDLYGTSYDFVTLDELNQEFTDYISETIEKVDSYIDYDNFVSYVELDVVQPNYTYTLNETLKYMFNTKNKLG